MPTEKELLEKLINLKNKKRLKVKNKKLDNILIENCK